MGLYAVCISKNFYLMAVVTERSKQRCDTFSFLPVIIHVKCCLDSVTIEQRPGFFHPDDGVEKRACD